MKLVEVTEKTIPAASIKDGPMCPHCGALTEQSIIPCPDGPKEISPGVWQVCAVVHIGWACRCCSPTRYFTEEP